MIQSLPATADSDFVPVSNGRSTIQAKTGSISGVVHGQDSKGLEGVTVLALAQEGESRGSVTVVSDNKGRFSFPTLTAGTYELEAVVNEGWLMTRPTKSVVVRAGENTAVDFRPQFIEGCQQNATTSVSLGTADKAEIVRWIVAEVIEEETKKSPTSEKRPILSTHKIGTMEIPSTRLQLWTPEEIQRVANRQGDYMYWQFDDFRVAGSCIAVSFSNLWADGTSTIETGPKSPGGELGFVYAFRKQDGKWIGKFISGLLFD